MNSIPPFLLSFLRTFVVTSGALLIAAHTLLLARGADRAGLDRSVRWILPLVAAVVLSAWFGWANALTLLRSAAPPDITGSPRVALPVLAAIVVPIGLGLLALRALRPLRAVNAAMPAHWLIAVQTYRIAGVMFLWPYLARGVLPAGFALPAGIGDFLTGAAAPFVASALAANRPGARRRAVAWNWFGIADLVVAPIAAVLSHAAIASLYPLGLIALFLGPPLGVLTHVYSLRNLRVSVPSPPPRAAAQPLTAGAAPFSG